MTKNSEIVDIKPKNEIVLDWKPKNEITEKFTDQLFSKPVVAGQSMGLLLSLTYPTAQTFLSAT